MLNLDDQIRLNSLRDRERTGTLSAADARELARLLSGVEAAESRYLRPARERARAEAERIERENAVLADVLRRKRRLANNMRRYLASVLRKQAAMDAELAAVGAAPRGDSDR